MATCKAPWADWGLDTKAADMSDLKEYPTMGPPYPMEHNDFMEWLAIQGGRATRKQKRNWEFRIRRAGGKWSKPIKCS